MITYELSLLLRIMPKPETVATLKRTAEQIFEAGGVIRKLENLGSRPTPFKMSNHGQVYREANYFMCEFHAPPSSIKNLLDEYGRDIDIIRRRIYKKNEVESIECTLHEEMLPAPYRKEVQEMMAQTKRTDKKKFSYNTGLDYYPFQK